MPCLWVSRRLSFGVDFTLTGVYNFADSWHNTPGDNNMEHKVIFFDVDGTLVTGDHVLPESTTEALYRAHEKGHRLVVNTGRPYGHVEDQIKKMPFDGFVCSLGGYIRWQGKELYYRQPSPELCRRVHELAKACRMSALYEWEYGAFDAIDPANPYARKDRDWLKKIGVPVWNAESKELIFDKFVCWPLEHGEPERFCRELDRDYDFIHREHNMMEVVGKGLTKAGGMQHLAQLLGFRREDTFAVGDGPNDLAMLRAAGTSILMGNAPERLWHEADYVTAHILDDGIYKAMDHYGLI